MMRRCGNPAMKRYGFGAQAVDLDGHLMQVGVRFG